MMVFRALDINNDTIIRATMSYTSSGTLSQ